jgi:hypothetical protein
VELSDALKVSFLIVIAVGLIVWVYYWLHPKHRARRLMERLERRYLSTQPGPPREGREWLARPVARNRAQR